MINVNYNLKDIKDEAISDTVFFRGMDYYNKSKVKQCEVELHKAEYDELYDGDYTIHTIVEGSYSAYYDVFVEIDCDGDIGYYQCDCPSFSDGNGACKHIVATLTYFMRRKDEYELDVDDDIDPSGFTDLMNVFMNNSDQNLSDNCNSTSLVPTIEIENDNGIYLSFKIGASKLYVVKNVYELFRNIRNKITYSYGKKLELNHDINNFDDKSKKLILFLTSICKELYNFNVNESYNYYYYNDRRFLHIEESRVDDLFEFFENQEIDCNIVCNSFENKTNLKFITENPNIKFDIRKYNDKFFMLTRDTSDGKLLTMDNAKYSYIIDSKYFYRISDEYRRYVSPVINTIKDCGEAVYIPTEKYNVFYSTVIKEVSKLCEVKIDPSIDIELIDEDLVVELYLDINSDGAIILDIMYSYGDIRFNIFNTDDENIKSVLANVARDLKKEKEIVKDVIRLGFIEDGKKYALSDEEMIYNFISEGISLLMDRTYINVTDKFKNIEIKNPRPISMGVKFSNNLIELNVESLDFDYSELKTILKKYRQRKKYHRLKDGSFVNISDNYFETIDKLIEDCSISEKDLSKGLIYIPKYRSLYLERLTKNNESINAERSLEFKQMTKRLSNIEECDIQSPESLNAKLRNYQENGFMWLKTLANYSLGGILADDMGLGKTLQIISLLLKEKEESSEWTQSIVVCPASLIYNWQAEIDKFAPSLKSLIVSGSANQRKILLDYANDYDLIITSYDSVKRDIDIYQNIKFKYCIVDEAQYIKNSNTQNSAAVKGLNSEIRFALTGTPIENSLSDLWSIFDFVMPGFLLSYSKFREKYELPIVKDGNVQALDRLNMQIKPFILRRTKKEVLKELPDKIETVNYAEMYDEQRLIYKAELMKANEQFTTELAENGFDNSRIKILALLTRLRQLCCHPALYIENYSLGSAKLDLCMDTVHSCMDNGHKMLIFSQFTSMLDIISKKLDEEGIEYYVLTGKTKVSDRLNLTTRFNQNNVPVFLISLKAGGTGLNLTGADVVIHYDPWWNTSAQNQATDRTHRIGQTNKVNEIKLIVKDSIEEKIEILQRKKQSLIDSVITEKEVMLSSLTKEEIQELLKI